MRRELVEDRDRDVKPQLAGDISVHLFAVMYLILNFVIDVGTPHGAQAELRVALGTHQGQFGTGTLLLQQARAECRMDLDRFL